MEVSGEIAVAFHGNEEDKGALEANEYIAQAIAADADHVLRLSVRRRGSQGEKGEVERHLILRFLGHLSLYGSSLAL